MNGKTAIWFLLILSLFIAAAYAEHVSADWDYYSPADTSADSGIYGYFGWP